MLILYDGGPGGVKALTVSQCITINTYGPGRILVDHLYLSDHYIDLIYLTMYELMILGQLSRRPMHGYMIAKIIGHMVGPFRQVQWGALYPVLTRLEQHGLIRTEESEEPSDGRVRKVYAITEAGEAHLHELLLDTEHHLTDYATLFPFKVALFHRLSARERLQLARHYTVYAQQHIDHLERKCRDLSVPDLPLTPEQRDDILSVMTHGIERWCRERAWGEQLISQQSIEEAS